jgi:hypothetical protein
VAVVVALAERLVPSRSGWPRPLELDLPRRVDGIVALLPGPERKEIGQLVRLFENALAGFALDGQLRTFTDSTPEQQDVRIRAWQTSRYRLRRSGFRALKKIVYGAYYGAPAAWPAIGYPGPPRVSAPATAEAPEAEATGEQAPPRPPPRAVRSTPPAPRAVEDLPAPRSGMDLPQERKP